MKAFEIDWIGNGARVLPTSYRCPSMVAIQIPNASGSIVFSSGIGSRDTPDRSSTHASCTPCSRSITDEEAMAEGASRFGR